MQGAWLYIPGEKTVFLSHLYIEMLFLPRQARDEHRENSKKTVLLQKLCPCACAGRLWGCARL